MSAYFSATGSHLLPHYVRVLRAHHLDLRFVRLASLLPIPSEAQSLPGLDRPQFAVAGDQHRAPDGPLPAGRSHGPALLTFGQQDGHGAQLQLQPDEEEAGVAIH